MGITIVLALVVFVPTLFLIVIDESSLASIGVLLTITIFLGSSMWITSFTEDNKAKLLVSKDTTVVPVGNVVTEVLGYGFRYSVTTFTNENKYKPQLQHIRHDRYWNVAQKRNLGECGEFDNCLVVVDHKLDWFWYSLKDDSPTQTATFYRK